MAIYHEDPEGMAKYLPKMYYGEIVDQYSVFMEGHSIKMKKDSEMAIIVIENLFQNMTNISWLDLKLGQITGSRKSCFADIEGYITKSNRGSITRIATCCLLSIIFEILRQMKRYLTTIKITQLTRMKCILSSSLTHQETSQLRL